MTRTFEARAAVREQVPLLIGLVGPSGTGKTFSALRLAGGIQRVSGGEIFVIDTESRRSLHYAAPPGSKTPSPGTFVFQHVPFGAPFSPLDYLEAIEYCLSKGAKTIIVDSMSHEHESVGGVLEMHDAETKRIAAAWKCSEDKAKMAAWNKPKTQRRRLINSILQMSANFIFCFRAKKKLKIERGKDPEPRGYMPIAGEEFIFEMILKCLLLPGANGFPTWQSDYEDERAMVKLPQQFRPLFQKSEQLSEDIGEQLARWAAGEGQKAPVDIDDLLKRYAACSDAATLRTLEEERKSVWMSAAKDAKVALRAASEATAERMKAAEAGALAAGEEPPKDEPNGAPAQDPTAGSDRPDLE